MNWRFGSRAGLILITMVNIIKYNTCGVHQTRVEMRSTIDGSYGDEWFQSE